MEKYEYHVEPWQNVWQSGRNLHQTRQVLKALGDDGWKLVQVINADHPLEATAIFVRQTKDHRGSLDRGDKID